MENKNQTLATDSSKKLIVLSGINLFRGGTLKIMQDCIAALSAFVDENTSITALVHDSKLYHEYHNVRYIAFPKSRKSWLFRLYYEYIGFRKLSKQLNPSCWISMHDTTPNVTARRRIVYCHNSLPFYRPSFSNIFFQPGVAILCMFSYYFFKINIHKNNYIIVQQEWFRQEFRKLFHVNNIIVSLPAKASKITEAVTEPDTKTTGKIQFFYPSTPMIHKNIETACRAAQLLEQAGITNFELALTFDGTENRYARKIYNKYKNHPAIHFTGFLSRTQTDEWYRKSHCLIFTSKIETWGLPISEAKEAGKPLIIPDLPYARETVGNYNKACFFNPDRADTLAALMRRFINHQPEYDKTQETQYQQPFAQNWNELFQITIKSL
jgi:glycosyltransferase involved in cell wall biosynthesis